MADVADFWKVKIPPPLWYALAVVIGVGLDAWVVKLSLEMPTALRIGGSLALALAFVALAPNAVIRFRRVGQDETPWAAKTELVLSGPYRFTRNPMYVGLAFLQASIALGLANGWILVALPVSLTAVYLTAIRFEEAYLEAEFGESYRSYKTAVRRWL